MDNTYMFYLTFGTVPSLFSEMSVFLDDRPSYLFVRSSGNFNFDALKQLKHVLGYHKFTGGDKDYIEDQYTIVRDSIIEAKEKNEDAKFVVYIDDSRVQFYLKPFIEADAIDDIKKLVILSEGNSSKCMYYKLKKDDEIECKKKWNNLIDHYNDTELVTTIDNYAFWLSTQKDVEYLLPYYQKFNNPNVSKSYREKMNLKEFPVEKMYKKLNDNQKKYIYDFEELPIYSYEKYIVIIGTYDFGSKELTIGILENLIDQLADDYKDYKFLYKSHPLFPVDNNSGLKKYLDEKEISVLPSKIPIEILLWNYSNISIGGFSSSVVSLIEPSRVKFLFGQNIGYGEILFTDLPTYDLKLSSLLAVQMLNDRYSLIEDNRAHYAELLEMNKRLARELEELKEKIDKENNFDKLSKKVSKKIKRIFNKN